MIDYSELQQQYDIMVMTRMIETHATVDGNFTDAALEKVIELCFQEELVLTRINCD